MLKSFIHDESGATAIEYGLIAGLVAVAIIAGILFATFLTLILVPVMYSLVDDMTEFFRKHYTNHEESEVVAGNDAPRPEAPVRGRPGAPDPLVPQPEPIGVRRQAMGTTGLIDPQPEAG